MCRTKVIVLKYFSHFRKMKKITSMSYSLFTAGAFLLLILPLFFSCSPHIASYYHQICTWTGSMLQYHRFWSLQKLASKAQQIPHMRTNLHKIALVFMRKGCTLCFFHFMVHYPYFTKIGTLRSENKLNILNKILHYPNEGKQYLVWEKCWFQRIRWKAQFPSIAKHTRLWNQVLGICKLNFPVPWSDSRLRCPAVLQIRADINIDVLWEYRSVHKSVLTNIQNAKTFEVNTSNTRLLWFTKT